MFVTGEGHIRDFHGCQGCSQNKQNSDNFSLYQHTTKILIFHCHLMHAMTLKSNINRNYTKQQQTGFKGLIPGRFILDSLKSRSFNITNISVVTV